MTQYKIPDEEKTPLYLKPVTGRLMARFDFNRPVTYLVMGNRNTGKSAFIEVLAENHDNTIIDLYGSKDNENLCWCRKTSPIDDILLVHGDNTTVTASFDTAPISDVNLSTLEGYKAVVTCNSFFSSDNIKFDALEKLTGVLYERTQWNKGHLMFMAFRETMDLIYSKMHQGVGEKDAKAQLLYFMRQLRHFGVSVGADMLRWTGIDKELRDLSEYIVFKKIGYKGLPRDLRFIYKYVNPITFRYMKHNQIVMLQENGNMSLGKFDLPKYHKEEGVDLLRELDITISHSAAPESSTQQKIGDMEHFIIMELYKKHQSYRVVSEHLPEAGYEQRSISSIGYQVTQHNKAVKQKGSCDRCNRATPGTDIANIELYTG